jgi:hypothetical protein
VEYLEARTLLSFGPPASYLVGASPVAVVARDFDGNGRPDLAAANREGGSVTVLRNVGGGNKRISAVVIIQPGS